MIQPFVNVAERDVDEGLTHSIAPPGFATLTPQWIVYL
jgi:hypothetical protein